MHFEEYIFPVLTLVYSLALISFFAKDNKKSSGCHNSCSN